ncbi:unnamed protein product [Rotaria sordida]|uniref:Uncharacterized protein n=1 Tax=Rotaria sordida TaxID=392033 RepID=A0A813USR1_9BILA|nr:unnamed protein product [Rotaria sordida]
MQILSALITIFFCLNQLQQEIKSPLEQGNPKPIATMETKVSMEFKIIYQLEQRNTKPIATMETKVSMEFKIIYQLEQRNTNTILSS